jgi:hypothetical protein
LLQLMDLKTDVSLETEVCSEFAMPNCCLFSLSRLRGFDPEKSGFGPDVA